MTAKFNIEITSFKTIHTLPNSWTKQNLIDLLELIDFAGEDNSSEKDLYDYISMGFQELEPDESAEIVLKYIFGDKLNQNQITEIAHEMQEENLWEEYGDMSFHEDLFKATSLLYHAYNGKFPHPDAAEIELKIESTSKAGNEMLEKFDESLIARIIAAGQTDHAIINRLFDDKIKTDKFDEAKDIIWQYNILSNESPVVNVKLTTGIYWVKELKQIDTFTADAFND